MSDLLPLLKPCFVWLAIAQEEQLPGDVYSSACTETDACRTLTSFVSV